MTEREIFVEALSLPAAEKASYLDRACGQDAALRGRLERLLALHDTDCPLLDRPAVELPSSRSTNPSPDPLLTQLAPFLVPSPRPGALGRLGHNDLLEELGRGGCGVVFRAFDDRLQRVVALKILSPHLAATSPPRQRFLREARAAAQVRHENVVQVYAVEEEPLPYLVMEYIDGPTLQARLDAEGPLPPAEVVRLGTQVAQGLAGAHAKGLIHRDVKPANILLDSGPQPRARLTDFGLARAADDASMTQSGVLAGTPLYMSPEQAQGDLLDPRADLFSLGSVLYTMVAGRPPFRAPTPLAVLERVARDNPRPLPEVIGDTPPGLVAVISRLMQKSPAGRFASAGETVDALSRCLTSPAVGVAGRGRRGRRLVVATAALLLVAGAVWGTYHLLPVESPGQKTTASSLPPASPDPSPSPPPPANPLPENAIVVTSTLDDGSPGTLRWAVEKADTRSGADTIVFDPVGFATHQTISLTRGELKLTDPAVTTILGPSAGLTISGKENGDQRAFGINGGSRSQALATIRGLTLADCNLRTGNGSRGGAVFVGNADVVLDQMTLSGNFCNFGGGIFNDGVLRVTNSTLTRNASTAGGAILSFGTLTVVNSTFSANRASESGGAIQISRGSAKVLCSTFTANVADRNAGAVFHESGATVTLANTIAAGNRGRAEPDLGGAMTVTGCLIGSTAGATLESGSARNITGESPRLGPLGRNGGPTETHPLLPDSPAIDAGDNDLVPANLRTDQRGRPRIANGRVDIGAVEHP